MPPFLYCWNYIDLKSRCTLGAHICDLISVAKLFKFDRLHRSVFELLQPINRPSVVWNYHLVMAKPVGLQLTCFQVFIEWIVLIFDSGSLVWVPWFYSLENYFYIFIKLIIFWGMCGPSLSRKFSAKFGSIIEAIFSSWFFRIWPVPHPFDIFGRYKPIDLFERFILAGLQSHKRLQQEWTFHHMMTSIAREYFRGTLLVVFDNL